MSRRPSILSILSPSQSFANGSAKSLPPVLHKDPQKPIASGENVNPDELFTRHTVAEVKLIQQRLRSDADAKQEDLRVMVGERYRDLLQASSSIISVAQSSKRVLQAIEEVKTAVSTQEALPPPTRPSALDEDSHLRALQLLSSHMKLLLDAPEHLWRLIERKKYYTATWLLRLSNVVHRSLIGNDDEQEWNIHGVDVEEQFPLIQRQLEVIKQFQPQISHKATLSLRDHTATPEETCATLLALHLLDAPLSSTLKTFLDQRTKSLNALIVGRPIQGSPSLWPGSSIRENVNRNDGSTEQQQRSAREIQKATLEALEVVSGTIATCRRVYTSNDKLPALMDLGLQHVQLDPHGQEQTLPSELQLSTQSLIMTLPSSAHFLLLPSNIRSYRPNVSSFSLAPSQVNARLDAWFTKSLESLQIAAEKLFTELRTVKDVWYIRVSMQKWIITCRDLNEAEKHRIGGLVDDVSQARILDLWQSALAETQVTFSDALLAAIKISKDNFREGKRSDESPAEFLFEAPPLPSSNLPSIAVDTPFHKYKTALKRRLIGRTSLLDGVLKTLELCARTIMHDFSEVLKSDDGSEELSLQMKDAYRPHAKNFCMTVLARLESAAEITEESRAGIHSTVVVGRIASELAHSPFIADLGCRPEDITEFQNATLALSSRISNRWRLFTVSWIIEAHRRSKTVSSQTPGIAGAQAMAPSSNLVHSLVLVTEAVQELGISLAGEQQEVIEEAVQEFVKQLIGNIGTPDNVDSVQDLTFVRTLASLYAGGNWSSVLAMVEQANQANATIPKNSEEVSHDYLTRTQILLSPLLTQPPILPRQTGSDKFATLLPFGAPSTSQQTSPALELAAPSPRFGLLLVNTGK